MTVLKKYDADTSAWETIVVGKQGPQGDVGEGVAAGGTTGQSLVKASGTNYDTTWDDRLPLNSTLYFPAMRSGRYYGLPLPPLGSTFTSAPTQSQLLCYAIIVPNAVTVDRIGAEVTTGAASSTVRLGIYEHDATTDYPGDLVIDAGTIDGNTTGFQEITISQALTPGIYWLAAVTQGGAPTLRVSACVAPWLTPGDTSAVSGSNNIAGPRSTTNTVTGALPDPVVTTQRRPNAPLIQFRIA